MGASPAQSVFEKLKLPILFFGATVVEKLKIDGNKSDRSDHHALLENSMERERESFMQSASESGCVSATSKPWDDTPKKRFGSNMGCVFH